MDHVILTRFNLPSVGAESIVRAREGWLTERVGLFERYCLPSVRAQTSTNFRWLIYFDPESPRWLKDRIRAHGDAYTPVFRERVDRAQLLADIGRLFPTRGDGLITTNLDNDDGLAADFVARLQAVPAGPRTAVYLANGLVKSPGGVFAHHDPDNAFASVRESWDEPITCWADWHNRLHRHAAVLSLGGAPGWLQVVHGGNVSNRTRGRLVSPAPYRALFGDALDDVPEPDGRVLARDRFVGHPLRVARDGARHVAKAAAMRLFGPDGFEKAKRVLAARGRVGSAR
ncbi:glycosyltransferase [Saccharothrix australiensis]|uniref:Putative rhamnosyltransferase n=1 Tax=Saccharothrix australiensis TaxID=2072 RepID=A0A495VXJ0_9PSEU|nr:glycosyltransferase [Saccharothrix australiensis]RKT53969.1 putative rhamnosyltransferase [Saccharothrix australiensis]